MSTTAKVRPARMAPPRVVSRPAAGGGQILSAAQPLEPYEPSLGVMLRRSAARTPDRVMLAQRDDTGAWREVTYAQAERRASAIAQALLDRGLGGDDAVMILSGNSIEHALLMLGATLAGVPVAPVSPAYSLMSNDLDKVRHIASLVRPSVVFADDAERFSRALAVRELEGAEKLSGASFGELLATTPTPAVDQALAAVGPDTVAKVLFTSGSTDMPKGVRTTHRMLCSSQQALAQIWPFVSETRPVLVDWLPWSHTFGGNHNFNLVLKHGGTLYIDEGKPAPGLLDATLRNLRAVSPTISFNVPAGYAQLVEHLERDAELRRSFFARLQLIFYAGAALPEDLWQRLDRLATAERGEPVMMTSSWGLTETSPLATAAHYPVAHAGVIGVPVPGTEIKLAPNGGKLEMRVRGPNVTPGYIGPEEVTANAFDEEGFYVTGDAGVLADPADLDQGLVFDGRIAENFKLSSGTWVAAGRLRVAALAACDGLLQDAVVCGHDRDAVGLLAWLNVDAARRLRERLSAYNRDATGSSTRVARLALLAEPPSLDHNEITDKGYVNQRAALARRATDVERLYADPPGDDIVVCR